MTETLQNGALLDTRPESEKQKDWKQEEVVAAAANPIWEEKPQSKWRKFPIFNQNGSGSCVAQTEAKELGIMRSLTDGIYVHFSATDIYQRRVNKPGSGMIADDARRIIATMGATLEVLTPSQSMTDSAMDTALVEGYKRDVGRVFSVPNHLALPTKNVDAIASTIQATKKGVMTWFYFKSNEWTDKPQIKHPSLPNSGDAIRHSVCAVDFALINGKKHIIVEDSWGPGAGMGGQRAISEEFFSTRNWFADYLINFKFQEQVTPKPVAFFQNDLEFGMQSPEVSVLQDCLRYLGKFPANAASTGYFGAITRKGVESFQTQYGIASPGMPGFGRFGPKTRAQANIIFAP